MSRPRYVSPQPVTYRLVSSRHVFSRLVLLRHVKAFWLPHVNACGPMVLQANKTVLIHTIKYMKTMTDVERRYENHFKNI